MKYKPKFNIINTKTELSLEIEITFHKGTATFTGNLEIEEKMVEFTHNIAPNDLEDTQGFLENLISHVDDLAALVEFITILRKNEADVKIEPDFYWSDNDLNVRIAIAYDHPFIKHLNLHQYK